VRDLLQTAGKDMRDQGGEESGIPLKGGGGGMGEGGHVGGAHRGGRGREKGWGST
jgi:hypothetical protein